MGEVAADAWEECAAGGMREVRGDLREICGDSRACNGPNGSESIRHIDSTISVSKAISRGTAIPEYKIQNARQIFHAERNFDSGWTTLKHT